MSYFGLQALYTPSDRIDVPAGSTMTAGWIVCRGGVRLTSGGLVACPVGRSTPLDDCLACRFLEAVEDERDAAYSCAADATADDAPPASEYEPVPMTSHELAVELL
jgi:hypothetical protein